MRTDIYPELIRASAQQGGLSFHELTVFREMNPHLAHIADLIEDLQEQLEDVVPAEEMRDLEKHYEEKLGDIRDYIRDIEGEYACLEDTLVEANGKPRDVALLDQQDIDTCANALSDMHEAIKFAELELES
jgi:hypothetical protein